MKALLGRQNFELEWRESADRPLGPGMVRVRPIYCGVCGTDLHFLRHMEEFTPLGHEISAEVLEIAGDVQRVKPGDHVIVEDVTMCGACEACKSGDINHCRSGFTLDGQSGMSTQMVVHHSMLNPYAGIDDLAACMTEPLAVALRGVMKLDLQPFASVAVFGMGAIGLFSAAAARQAGAGRIAMFARSRNSLRNREAEQAAYHLGADEVYYSSDGDDLEQALQKGEFDAAVVAAPPSMCAEAMKIVGYGGKVLAMGVTFGSDSHANLDVNDMVFNKKQLITSIAEPAMHFPLSLKMIQSGRIDARRVITHVIGLDDAAQLKELYAQDAPAIKTVIKCT